MISCQQKSWSVLSGFVAGAVDVVICVDLTCCAECSLLSVRGVYIRKRLFHPHSIVEILYVKIDCSRLLCELCMCAYSCCIFAYFCWVFANIDTISVFHTLCAVSKVILFAHNFSTDLFLFDRISDIAHMRTFYVVFCILSLVFGTICTNTVVCYVVCSWVLLSSICTIF